MTLSNSNWGTLIRFPTWSFDVASLEDLQVIHGGAHNQTQDLVSHYRDMWDNLGIIIRAAVENINSIPDSDRDMFVFACNEEMKNRSETTIAKDLLDKAPKQNASEQYLEELRRNLSLAEDRLNQSEALAYSTSIDILDIVTSKDSFVCNGSLDEIMFPYMILSHATPEKLAKFSENGKDIRKKAMIDELLSNVPLMREIVFAGGAKHGNYGEALIILDNIIKASSCLRVKGSENAAQKYPILKNLALGTSLEHAVGINIFDTNSRIDPTRRYLHYEQAFLNDELDPCFEIMSAWECRWITNSDASDDDQTTWCRNMMRNYRPDQVLMKDYRWRYAQVVRSEVRYKVPEWKFRPKTYQQLLSGGGKCGPRAWFGRFATRSFGIPTWGIRQPGHAAMTHWTPFGWVICLGGMSKENLWGGWRKSWWIDPNRSAWDFLFEAEARMSELGSFEYMSVIRLECLSMALGEKTPEIYQLSGFWGSLSIMLKKRLAKKVSECSHQTKTLLQNSDCLWEERGLESVLPICSGELLHEKSIIVRADSCKPARGSGSNVVLMSSFENNLPSKQIQLHQKSNGQFHFSAFIPEASHYFVFAKVVTVHEDQNPLELTVDSCRSETISIPYTLGEWKETPKLCIYLDRGAHEFIVSRKEGSLGLSLKYFEFTPVEDPD